MRLILLPLRGCWLAFVSFVLVTTALAAGDQRPTDRFDGKVLRRPGLPIAVAPRALEQLDPSDNLRAGWEEFERSRGGGWKVYLDERTGMPAMLSGRGIEWYSPDRRPTVTLDDLESSARAFLSANRALLGDWTPLLEMDPAASRALRRGHWQIVFRQVVDGVRVENSRLEFHVNGGRLVLFGASNWARPTISGFPALDESKARAVLDEYLGVATAGFEPAGEPELTVVAFDADRSVGQPRVWTGARGDGLDHALIWRFRFREAGRVALWVGEVGAHDGSMHAFYDGAHYASVRGGVFPVSSDGDCADAGCEVRGFPMPYVDYTVDGQTEEFADAFGNLQCGDPQASVETDLVGKYVRVVDQCGALAEGGTCATDISLGLKHGENCEVAPGASPGNTAAARSGYYHVNRVAEAARFYDPDNQWLQQRVTLNVNIASSCNAVWNGEINMYGSGNGCGNTGELQGILVHEWGHGYDHNDGGGVDLTSEAYADVVAILASRDSCVGRGVYTDGRTCTGFGDTCQTCTGFRDHDWAARQWNTPATPAGFVAAVCPEQAGGGGPCGRQVHCEAYPIAEAIYDLATRDLPAWGLDPATAWQLTERLWYQTRPGSGGDIYNCHLPSSDSCGASSWYQRMRVADDDDGDLSNGTPHAAALYAAFARHEIACGQPGDPDNQSASGCPTLAQPWLSVAETEGGPELSWAVVPGASEYRVYRGELGCDAQLVPLVALGGASTRFVDGVADPGLPRFYRVEAFGSNPACFGPVSNCAATPDGARLQKSGHRVVDDDSNGNATPDPGETVRLPVTLFNSGLEDALATTGRLRLIDPAQGRVVDPEATWTGLASSTKRESDDPHFELTVFENVMCGDTVTFELDMQAVNAPSRTRRFEIALGESKRDFVNGQIELIPPETTTPVTSTIVVDQELTLVDLDLALYIAHDLETELIVELTSPEGTTVRLHDRSATPEYGILTQYDLERDPDGPGSMADFVGESTLGTWTLSVQDVGDASNGYGRINVWSLHMTVAEAFDCVQLTCPEPEPAEAVGGLRIGVAPGGSRTDLVFAWDPLAAAAGYHVLQSTSASFATTVELTGRTSGANALTVPNRVSPTPILTFFQVRGVNSCNQEGP